jgi:hypothetical protein
MPSQDFASGNVVRGNVVQGIAPYGGYGIGMNIGGDGAIVSGNLVTGVRAWTGYRAYGILVDGNLSLAEGNTVIGAQPQAPNQSGAQEYGVRMQQGVPASVCRDNVVGHYQYNLLGCVDDDNTTF